jgi:hypothetical protein
VRATAQLLIAYDVTSLADAASLDSRECLHRMEQQSAEFVGLVEQVSAAWSVQLPRIVPCEYAYLDPSARGGEFAERLIADSLRSTTHFRSPDNLDAALAAALSTAAGSSVTRSLGTVARADVAPPVRRAVPAAASAASASSAAAAKPGMFAPKRQHPSLASVAVAARATAAPKHKVVIMSTQEWNQLDGTKGARRGVAAADVDERKKQLASDKQAEREQKVAARAEAKLKREAERAAKKQLRADGAERAPRPKKARKAAGAPSDGALAAVDGMGQLITAVGEKSDDDDDDFDSDDDDVDDDESVSQETEVARRMQKTLRHIEGSSAAPPVHSLTQSSFMLGTSAPLFPAKSASVAPPSGAPQWAATSEPDYSKMLSAVMPHVTSLPVASAAAALASLMPMSTAAATAAPPPPPPVAEPDRNSVEAMVRNVFEGADPSLVSAAHEEQVRRFLAGQADNYDAANPVQALLIRRVVVDDVEVSLVIELNYATKTWRKLNRRKRLGPQV